MINRIDNQIDNQIDNRSDNRSDKQLEKIIEELQPFIKETNNVYLPIGAPNDYIKIILKNKMQIFIVNDQDSSISSAVMYVGVGSDDNPSDLDGLAHYLEHMLFMGSDMYPGSTYFQNQVSTHGGYTNAFTTNESTQYYFSVGNNFLNLLKIFSRFFVHPLFDVKWVDKEVNAVDSEHKKNIGSDGWRLMNVAKKFFVDDINNRFSTGSRETLINSDSVNGNPKILRDRLVEFYNTHYSSDNMILYISHKIDNDTLKQITAMFEMVPIKNTVKRENVAKVKYTDNAMEVLKVKTVNEEHSISIGWLLNGSCRYVNGVCVDAYSILTYILNNSSVGGLYDMLKTTDIVLGVSCGTDRAFSNSCFYNIQIKFTPDGISRWKEILYLVDAYIDNLYTFLTSATYTSTSTSTANTNTDIFDDFYNEKKNRDLLFLQIIDKINGLDLCQYYADVYERYKINLSYVPIAFVLRGDKHVIRNHFMTCLQNMRLELAKVLVYSSLIDEKEFTEIDKFYNTRYEHTTLIVSKTERSQAKIFVDNYMFVTPQKNSRQVSSKEKYIRLPQLNPYIKSIQKLSIIDPIVEGDSSYRRINSSHNNLYYLKKGNTYKTYSVYCIMSIELESLINANSDIFMAILMYCLYISKIRETENAQMRNAKLSVKLISNTNGLIIIVSGYNTNLGMNNIFATVMDWYFKKDDNNTTSININTSIYEMMYRDLMSDLQNYQFSDVYTLVSPEFRVSVNKKHSISNEMMIDSLKKLSPENMSSTKVDNKINYDNFRNVVVDLMSKGQIMGVFGGSITVKQVMSITKYLENIIKPSTLLSLSYNLTNKELSANAVKTNINPNNSEKAIGYGVYLGNMREIGDEWKTKRPMCSMLEIFISDKFSASVRTEKQVGYVAICNIINVNEENNPDLHLVFTVQSTRDDAFDIVKDYVENSVLSEVELITDEEFESMKQSTITKLSQKPNNIHEDCDEFFTALTNTYDTKMLFSAIDDSYIKERASRKKIMVKSLNNLKRSDFVSFVQSIYKNGIYATIRIESLI